MTEMVTIPLSEYESLKEDSEWLGYLEAAGIDNTTAYEYAIDLRDMERGDEDGE